MNLKGLTGPLTERIGSLTALMQEMIDNIVEQTKIQKEILVKLIEIDDKLTKENICKDPKNK